MYKIRVILDTEKDVIRTILVDPSINLQTLHAIIAGSFGFNGSEMASFYLTDDQWNQGEEIPLFNMSESGEGLSMQDCFIKKILPNVADKLIYVYDYLKILVKIHFQKQFYQLEKYLMKSPKKNSKLPH